MVFMVFLGTFLLNTVNPWIAFVGYWNILIFFNSIFT